MRFTLNDKSRRYVIGAIVDAPDGYEVEIRPKKRSLDANAKFHAMCSDFERCGATHNGRAFTAEQWKFLLVSGHTVAAGLPLDVVQGLEGEALNIRESTAKMTSQRMASLIEYVNAIAADKGVHLRAIE